jgi:hypothetical protein
VHASRNERERNVAGVAHANLPSQFGNVEDVNVDNVA